MTSANGLVVANTVTVTPGATPTTLLSQMPAGTQILNLSTTSSIWVSDNQSVTPGIGYELGPQGSCVWQYDKQPCYACVDTGVTAPVSVTFGNSVSDVQNPTFVAIALALQGIPNVLIADTLFNGVLAAPLGNTQIDVSKYASVEINFATDPAALSPINIKGTFSVNIAGLGLTAVDGFNVTSPTPKISPNAGGLAIAVPVNGKILTLFNATAATPVTVTVVGTNRPVPSSKLCFAHDTIRRFTNIAGGASAETILVPSDGSHDEGTVFNGQVWISAFSSAPSGTFWLNFLQGNNTEENITLAPSLPAGGGFFQALFPHVFGRQRWGFSAPAAYGAGVVDLVVIPNVSS